jgi:hypothetical protein
MQTTIQTTMQTTIQTTMQTTTPLTLEGDYDFENDDDAFYDFIDFGIASNRGQLRIHKGA